MEQKKVYKVLGKRRAYILSFDRDDTVNYKKFHDQLIALPGIITWWHYIKSSYIIISQENANDLSAKVRMLVPNKSILIVEVDLKNMNGWLPQKAWDWLSEQKRKMEPK